MKCICDREKLRHSGGGRHDRIPLRDALKIYLWQHMSRHAPAWFTPVELCRVIAEQYTFEGLEYRTKFNGRLATVKSCLAELIDAGEVEEREIPHPGPSVGAGRGRSVTTQRQYRWCA